jgi:hypothetical protein
MLETVRQSVRPRGPSLIFEDRFLIHLQNSLSLGKDERHAGLSYDANIAVSFTALCNSEIILSDTFLLRELSRFIIEVKNRLPETYSSRPDLQEFELIIPEPGGMIKPTCLSFCHNVIESEIFHIKESLHSWKSIRSLLFRSSTQKRQ